MEKITTEEVRKRLNKRFSAPQWILCEEFEVPVLDKDYGHMVRARRIDAMAHALNPRSPCLFGFEIKTSRSDWLAELKDPEKAERFRRHCNAWYLVSPLKGVVKKEELPEGWGWMATHGKTLAIKQKSIWVDIPEQRPAIIAAFLRQSLMGRISEQQRQYAEGYSCGNRAEEWRIGRLEKRIAELGRPPR